MHERRPVPHAGDAYRRLQDVVVAVVLLVVLAPLLLLVAVAVRLQDGGPALFRQERLGLRQHPFVLLKFRTMRPAADESVHRAHVTALLREEPGPATVGAVFKIADDVRITPLGHLLRRTSIDELPQLLHVLRGDMTLVGPRPALAYELGGYEPRHFRRFEVKPGLTGLWQVSGRSRLSPRQALDLDVEYVARRSLLLDLQILALTPYRGLLQGGAR